MIKNIIYAILLILGGFGIKYLADYPFLLTVIAMGWCVIGALLLYNIITYILSKTTK